MGILEPLGDSSISFGQEEGMSISELDKMADWPFNSQWGEFTYLIENWIVYKRVPV